MYSAAEVQIKVVFTLVTAMLIGSLSITLYGLISGIRHKKDELIGMGIIFLVGTTVLFFLWKAELSRLLSVIGG